ncbi:MAG: N-6 DNA methylase [Actinomycetota bacterium]
MPIERHRLEAVFHELARKPGHEKVRALIHELCVVGLHIPENDVRFEVQVPEVRGRMDALLGDTIFEFKADLSRDRADAEAQLHRYLGERERRTGRRCLGIATDGAAFVAYQLEAGRLGKLDEIGLRADDPRAILRWLDTAVSVRDHLPPDPETVRSELGRDSLVYKRAMQELQDIWEEARHIPEVDLKRQMWGQHLGFVYGTLVSADDLFLQHTYLTLVAKIMAARALTPRRLDADSLLDGTPFAESGLNGAVETDFFDWVRQLAAGRDLIERMIRQVGRFRLADIEADVLKTLYESLIDPRQRHYLGEYYTPDWLAERMYDAVVPDPLETRVLDPACGSGTFLFHGVRRYLCAAEARGDGLDDALTGCIDRVLGLDVHPVAVLFSRVTYLLAIGPERLQDKRRALHVPVYLGDTLQWNVRIFMNEQTVDIKVPDGPTLRFPASVAGEAELLERVLRRMDELCAGNAPLRAFQSWLNAGHIPATDRRILAQTYEDLRRLHQAGRNHIWVYIVRNLTRPLWLSMREAKPDAVIGNPPWLKFNAMSKEMQARFRDGCRARGLWAGGNVATHQDLSAYFFARSAERYLRTGGRIAFVMPMATLTRSHYQPFRRGRFIAERGNEGAIVQFREAWTLDSDVKPLFPVPAAVLIAERHPVGARLPATVTAFHGTLPHRNATPAEAAAHLAMDTRPWPSQVETRGGSPYRDSFRNGATVLPRKLFLVVREEGGRLGSDPDAPVVASEPRTQEKRPWKDLPPLRGQVERQFLSPVLLGESVAPFRVLGTSTCILPRSAGRLMNAADALEEGHIHLHRWLATAEGLWNDNGSGDMTLLQQINYMGKLDAQAEPSDLRVVYTKSGANLAATVVRSREAIVDHTLYWYAPKSDDEARYLAGILNSETAQSRVQHLQARGQFGARHFDKVIFSLPIPRFDATSTLHRKLAQAALTAEEVAADAVVPARAAFVTARRIVRQSLATDGIAARLEDLVSRLLALP